MEDISQVASVYISGETFALAKQYTKVRGVSTDILQICETVKQDCLSKQSKLGLHQLRQVNRWSVEEKSRRTRSIFYVHANTEESDSDDRFPANSYRWISDILSGSVSGECRSTERDRSARGTISPPSTDLVVHLGLLLSLLYAQ